MCFRVQWTWRQHDPSRRWHIWTKLHAVTWQETVTQIAARVPMRTSGLALNSNNVFDNSFCHSLPDTRYLSSEFVPSSQPFCANPRENYKCLTKMLLSCNWFPKAGFFYVITIHKVEYLIILTLHFRLTLIFYGSAKHLETLKRGKYNLPS